MRFLIKTVNQHPNLIKAEIEILLKVPNIGWISNTICELDSEFNNIDKALKLSGTIRFVLRNPISIEIDEITSNDFEIIKIEFDILNEVQTFSVKHFKIGENKSLINSQSLAGKLGSKILKIFPHLKVDLKNPEIKIYSLSYNSKLYFGILYDEISFEKFSKKSPKKWLYFGGGAIKPELARILVNLMYPQDPIVIDPFCGHGGILREISDVNQFAIGFEISKKIIREAKDNNDSLGYNNKIALIQCDALKKPIRKRSVKMFITDPPYAIQTTTIGRKREELIIDWLNSLEIGSNVLISVPRKIQLNIPTSYDLILKEEDYVHKNLTREILKLRRISQC